MRIQSEFFDGVIWIPKILRRPLYIKQKSTSGTKANLVIHTNIVGNIAYFYNKETGESKSVYIPNSKISKLRKEVADWLKIHGKFRPGKTGVLIPRGEYTKLSRDPLAPFDYSGMSKRTGIVTKVLSANRIVIDRNYILSISGIEPPSKEKEPVRWEQARRFTQGLLRGQKVSFGVNMNNPYTQNGDINVRDVNFGEVGVNQQEQGWGVFDYLNISGFAIGALARNINIFSKTGQFGSVTTGDRYSLSDTYTFTRLYLQLTGQSKELGDTSKGETEGSWAEKLAIDIIFDPSNYISIGGTGISVAGKRIMKGARYMRSIGLATSRIRRLANTFEGHIAVGGLGKTIDNINRGWRRINMLLEPAYYTALTQLDLWNSMWIGGMNPTRLLDETPILSKAKSPIFGNDIAIRVAGKPGYTNKEVAAFLHEFEPSGKSAGFGDVANNPHNRPGLWDKLWAKPVGLAAWQSVKVRRAMFIDGLKRGLNPQEAANRVNHFLLNYDPKSLTAFEQAYINRIFPFYIPQTRNIALQVEQALKTPYKYTAIAKWQIQQRRFAETDQFKEFDRNTIIQKVGDGKYVKIRFPMEDLTQLPSKYSSIRKSVLSSTYPIFNMWPELYEDENYFDQTKISTNQPKYLAKKFLSREYYAIRDWNNPNIPLSEKISKHVFAVSFITPENKRSYIKSLMEAGFSPTEAEMEADAQLRRQLSFKTNAIRAVAQVQVQVALPESKQDRPYTLEDMSSIEYVFVGPQYYLSGGIYNIAQYIQSGRMGDKGIKDRVVPSQLIRSFEKKYMDKGFYNTIYSDPMFKPIREAQDFLADLILNPWNLVGVNFGAGTSVLVNGERKFLTRSGIELARSKMPLTLSGRAEGLYGKARARTICAIEQDRFLLHIAENPGFAEKMIGSRFMQSAGVQILGRTIVSHSRFVSSYRMATTPLRVYLRSDTHKAIGATVDSITDPVTKYVRSKMYVSEAQKHKWQEEITKRIKEHFGVTKKLKQLAVEEAEHMKSEAEIKLGVWESAKQAAKDNPTKGFFGHYTALSEETAIKLTDFSELGKSSASAQGVVDDITKEFSRMGNELTSRGIIKRVRLNYVSHILTRKYRILKGYTDPVLSRFHLKPSFTMHREIDGRIIELNAEARKALEIGKYEANIWRILKIAKPRHVEVVEDYEFLKRIIQEQGLSKWWQHNWFLKSYGESNIPMLRNVLLPKETIRALEEIPRFRNHIAVTYTKPGYIRAAYDDFNSYLSFYRRTVIGLNLGFVPRNFISSVHQNIQAGFYNIAEYLPNRPKNGVEFVTNAGRPIYTWELKQAYRDYNIIGQPGMGASGAMARREWTNALDKAGDTNNRLTSVLESWFRTRLFNQKVQEGMTFPESAAYVIAHHLDYTKKYSTTMTILSKFIMFPTWSFYAPKMVGQAMLERPWQFALMPKTADIWNSPSDKMLLQYKPEYLRDTTLYKIPFTEDSFFAFPLSTTELTQYPTIFHTKEFQFYWGEALANPNVLKSFARRYLNIEWLNRGGGSAKVKGQTVIITYMATGEQITASISNNKLIFIDSNTNLVIKEFEVVGTGTKAKVVTEGEILNELARKHLFPFLSMGIHFITGSQKYKPPNTGDFWKDAWLTVENLMGLGPIQTSIDNAIDEDIPPYQSILKVYGIVTFWNAHTSIGLTKPPKLTKTKDISNTRLRQTRRVLAGGRYHR
jgi:hypothetical protein